METAFSASGDVVFQRDGSDVSQPVFFFCYTDTLLVEVDSIHLESSFREAIQHRAITTSNI